MDAFLIDCLFEVRHDIRSLPPFHGARWSAWMRFACRKLGVKLEDFLCSLLPLQQGQHPLLCGDKLTLRLHLSRPEFLPPLVASMMELSPHGEFSGESLSLLGFRDALSGKILTPQDAVQPLTESRLASEIEVLMQCESWTLELWTPLRLTLPAGMKSPFCSGKERFCNETWLTRSDALPHMLAHVRGMEAQLCGQGVSLRNASLRWEDMRYNARREIALGGVLGNMNFAGMPDKETARRLVWGQYVGAGKNGRFGLGFWRLPELDNLRQTLCRGEKCL